MVSWNTEQEELVKECLEQGGTHKEIADFIFEDFGIVRTVSSVKSKCYKLGLKSKNSRAKLTTEQYREQLPSDIKLLGNYINDFVKILHKCLVCTNTWLASPGHIKQGTGCPKCAGTLKLTTEKYKQQLPNDIGLLEEYVNSRTPILHKCLVCNNKWKASPNNIKKGHSCPRCANKARPGYYASLTKEQADSLGYPLYLYNVKLQYEDEVFYKIGLTKNEDRSRFKNYKPYKVIEEISFEEYDAWTAICKEEDLKLRCNYTAKHKFGGYNECYRIDNG